MTLSAHLTTARARIADCFMLDPAGRLVQRRNHLNLAGLGLTNDDLLARFHPGERALPEVGFEDLIHLRYLDLTENALTELPECVGRFTGLLWLGLNFNQLHEIEGIGNLTVLERLYLRGNKLTALPDGAGNLRALVELDLTGNVFVKPTRALLRLLEGRADGELDLAFAENPGEFTLRAADGISAFREHIGQLLEADLEVREGKLLLVGEGDMGKSTLLQALLGRPFVRSRKQTHGLKMKPLTIMTATGDVRLNCWDFSGQPQVRETHQIFFSEPAIYLLVWNARLKVDAEDLREWLWLIKHRTKGRGRVLVVATNVAENSWPLSGEHFLRHEFGGEGGILLPPEFLYVECDEKVHGGQRNISELRQWLRQIIETDTAFCQLAVPSWRKAQDELADLADAPHDRKFLPWAEFKKLCLDCEMAEGKPEAEADAEVRRFAKHQHEVGRCVWVDRGAMAHNVILSPDWLSKALSYIVRAESGDDEAERAGLLTEARIHQIWRDPQQKDDEDRPEPPMPEVMFPAFCAFMEEYDMAEKTIQADGVVRYLIPQRLPPNPPEAWDRVGGKLDSARAVIGRRIDLKGYDGKRGLNRWLLRAFFFRLMVRLHPHLIGRDDAKESTNWEHGFSIEVPYYGCARISSDKHHLKVEAAGVAPERLWWMVDESVRELGAHLKTATATEIKLERLVPCGGTECQRPVAEQCYLPETLVLNTADQKSPDGTPRQTIDCRGEDCARPLSLDALLKGVQAGPRKDGVEARGSEDSKLLREILAEVRAGAALTGEVLARLETLRAAVASDIRGLLDQLDSQERAGPALFLIVPRDPKFSTDKGKMFGKQFRLHLFCERLLLPVSWLKGTEACGSFDFEMDHAWWSNVRPYLAAFGPLFSTLLPAAGAVGGAAAALAESAKPLTELVEQANKLLDLAAIEDAPKAAATESAILEKGSLRAQGIQLTWLHDFLKKECDTDDLATAAKLGLRRINDKSTSRRYLWVHPTHA